MADKMNDKIPRDDEEIVCRISCQMRRDWMIKFVELLQKMEHDGNIGHSEQLTFFADGDGTFRPQFFIHEIKVVREENETTTPKEV